MTDPAPCFSEDFRLSGAHGGPRKPRERVRRDNLCRLHSQAAPETTSKAHSWANVMLGVGRNNDKVYSLGPVM